MKTQISGDILTSIKQCPTPLNNLFFSEFNQNLLQRGIREKIKQLYNVKIDYQNKSDLIALMRVIYIANFSDSYNDIIQQVRFMNGLVIKKASEQITTGLSQYYGFIKDVNSPINPMANPQNVNDFGNKLDINTKIGL